MFNLFNKEEIRRELRGDVFKAFAKGGLTYVEAQTILHIADLGEVKQARYYLEIAQEERLTEGTE